MGFIPGARQAKQERILPFQLQRHTGQHLTHHRLIDKVLTKRLPLMGMVQRHRQRPAHQPMATHCAVKARQPAHSEDLPNTIPLFAKQPASGIEEFRFTAGVGAIAELILKTLQPYGIALAVG